MCLGPVHSPTGISILPAFWSTRGLRRKHNYSFCAIHQSSIVGSDLTQHRDTLSYVAVNRGVGGSANVRLWLFFGSVYTSLIRCSFACMNDKIKIEVDSLGQDSLGATREPPLYHDWRPRATEARVHLYCRKVKVHHVQLYCCWRGDSYVAGRHNMHLSTNQTTSASKCAWHKLESFAAIFRSVCNSNHHVHIICNAFSIGFGVTQCHSEVIWQLHPV